MLDSHHPLHASIVRIRDEHGTIHGAGFLATPALVCTCAHVVADALNIPREAEQPPEREVHLDFPFLGEAGVKARIQVWVRMEPNDGSGDIAVLCLVTDLPASARPARLLPVSNLSGRDFEAYGFPGTTDVGQYAYGILRDRLANGYVQLESSTIQGYRVQQGYSGSPVWDQRGRGVVGMVVAEDRNPEAKVAFLIPTDLILHVCSNIKPATYHQLFAPLTDGLAGLPSSPLSGVEQFLRVYLGMPDAPAPFGGRQIQLAALDRWLANPAQPYALLVAEAGRGKSALLAQWVAAVADERRADVALVPISIRFGTSLKGTTVSLLGARIRHLHGVRANLPHDAEAWLAEIDMYLREDRPVGPPLLIVLDGADEAADWMVGRDLRFPPEPGRGIKVLVSARSLADCDEAGWVRRLEWQGVAVPMELPLLNRAGVAEVLRSMGDPLARLVTEVDAVDELHRLSEGDPLLVRLYVDALLRAGERAAFLTSEDLRHLKPGLEAYFDQWWDDQRRQWGTSAVLKELAVRTLLNLLACALGPLLTDDLLALMEPEQVDLWILKEALRPLWRFVVGDGKERGYAFSHPRLNQYFYEKLPQRERQTWEHRFLDYGRQTLAELTSGERDPSKVSSYSVRYYGAQLERVDAEPAHFDELVCDGWLRAWEGLEGTYDGFLSDLTRAWKRAEVSGAQAQNIQERGRAIGRQCRYALIVASIKSLAENIPPALLEALVDKGIWTPIQGLASIRQIVNEWQQALADVASHLSEPLLQEALAAARAFVDKETRAWALSNLVPLLPQPLQGMVLQEALAAARAIADKDIQAWALARLAPYLSEPLLRETLTAARAIEAESERIQAQALAMLVPRLGELGYGEEALAVVQEIYYTKYRTQALARLAPHLSESLLQEALADIQASPKGYHQAEALARLTPYLSEPLQGMVLQEALAATRSLAHKDGQALAIDFVFEDTQAEALAELDDGEEELMVAQAIADENRRAMELARLAPYLSEPLLREVLAAVRAMPKGYDQAKALAMLVPRLGELGYGEEALTVAQALPKGYYYVEALTRLAPYLSEPLLQEALAAAQAIVDERTRAEALTNMAPYLSEPLQGMALQEALAAAQAIEIGIHRGMAFVHLVPHLKQLPVVRLYALWCKTLHILANRTRPDLLLDMQALNPIIKVLGGKEALVAAKRAIIEVRKWFP